MTETPNRSDLRDRYAALDAIARQHRTRHDLAASRGVAVVWLILVALALLALIKAVA